MRLLILAMLCLALAGCQNGSGSSGTHDGSRNEEQQSYLASMQRQMKTMDDKIADLTERSRGLRDDARTQADQAIGALRNQREELGRQFDKLKDSSRDAWEGAKTGFTDAWAKMQDAFADARSKFN